ncbi:MAG TPA: trypsin-like serine protease, partial [Kofleriaceae bacterium]|nr:trypsin-like serine protease [Kofleriaceae bacterium]
MRASEFQRAAILCTVLALGAGGCDFEQLDGGAPQTEVGSIAQPIVGGTTAPFDDAVVMLSIGCTGTLIRPNVVLSAAHCLPSGSVSFGPAIGQFVATRRVIDSFDSRRYGAGLFGGGDIALLRLETDAPADIIPLPFNAALTLTKAEHTDAEVRTV